MCEQVSIKDAQTGAVLDLADLPDNLYFFPPVMCINKCQVSNLFLAYGHDTIRFDKQNNSLKFAEPDRNHSAERAVSNESKIDEDSVGSKSAIVSSPVTTQPTDKSKGEGQVLNHGEGSSTKTNGTTSTNHPSGGVTTRESTGKSVIVSSEQDKCSRPKTNLNHLPEVIESIKPIHKKKKPLPNIYPYECGICFLRMKTKYHLEWHLTYHDILNDYHPLKCSDKNCKFPGGTSVYFHSHVHDDHRKDKKKCSECKKTCSSWSKWRAHIRTEHPQLWEEFIKDKRPPIISPEKTKAFIKSKNFKSSTTTPAQTPLKGNFQCPHLNCSKAYQNMTNLCKHSIVHISRSVNCTFCGHQLTKVCSIRNHINNYHQKEKKKYTSKGRQRKIPHTATSSDQIVVSPSTQTVTQRQQIEIHQNVTSADAIVVSPSQTITQHQQFEIPHTATSADAIVVFPPFQATNHQAFFPNVALKAPDFLSKHSLEAPIILENPEQGLLTQNTCLLNDDEVVSRLEFEDLISFNTMDCGMSAMVEDPMQDRLFLEAPFDYDENFPEDKENTSPTKRVKFTQL